MLGKFLKQVKLIRPKTRRSKVFMAVSLLVVLAATGIFASRVLTASAFVAAKVCSIRNGYCMSLAPGVNVAGGDRIYGVYYTQTWRWNVSHSSVCNNGYVSSTCPFRVGSGLNTQYEGKPIYRFKLHYDLNYCAAADNENGSFLMYLRSCNFSANQLWVAKEHGSVGTTWTFVNVAASDYYGSGQAMNECIDCQLYMSLDNGTATNSNWKVPY